MSKVTKKDLNERLLMVETLLGLHRVLPEQISNDQANNAIFRMQCALSRGKELAERKPQLKQLDQSIFDGLDEKWRSAAVNTDGKAYLHNEKKDMMYFNHSSYGWCSKDYDRHEMQLIGEDFDPSGFAVGFIERDIAKELLEVDLSSELTGSDLARAMLANASKPIMCAVSDISTSKAMSLGHYDLIHDYTDEHSFMSLNQTWFYAIPINNQGEPLTASEVGL